MLFFARILQRIELFAKLGGILCALYLKCPMNEMAAAGFFLAQYCAFFVSIMSTRSCGAPVLERISYAQLLAPGSQ